MIVIEEADAPQGSEAWFELRRGVVTASEAKNIMTPTGKPSQSDYLYRLVAESLGEDESTWGGNEHTERGHRVEPLAVDDLIEKLYLEGAQEIIRRPVSFIYGDDTRSFGCSPDQLIKVDGRWFGVEAKAPKLSKVLGYRASGGVPNEYVVQVRYSLWAANYQLPTVEGWYFHAYHESGVSHTELVDAGDPQMLQWCGQWVPIFRQFMARYQEELHKAEA